MIMEITSAVKPRAGPGRAEAGEAGASDAAPGDGGAVPSQGLRMTAPKLRRVRSMLSSFQPTTLAWA